MGEMKQANDLGKRGGYRQIMRTRWETICTKVVNGTCKLKLKKGVMTVSDIAKLFQVIGVWSTTGR